jgi:hypothetical protein
MAGKKYYGNYIGLIIQNNDTEKRGRVKVYVPHIAAAIYTGWNKDFIVLEDKEFVFPDKDTNPKLDKIISYLKKTLPWAEQASPLFGGSASGRYNAFTKKGTTSDSNYWESNTASAGFRPLQNYVGENRLSDAFGNTHKVGNRTVNPGANDYVPADYSNLARGEFTIPNVGAHVWVFFIEGDPNYPVVFASSYGQEDWKRIYSNKKETETIGKFVSPDYPASYENLASDETKTGEINHDIKTFRAKHVFNSNKHTIEMIDTDLAEVLKLTHYSGSFLEFNNSTTTRLATNNDQTMILGDQFLTVKKNQSIYVANYQETIIDGDRILRLGDFNERRKLSSQILAIMRDTHDHKRLFEIKRTSVDSNHTSSLQSRSGVFADCPVCGGSGIKFDTSCITCGGSGKSPSSQWGKWIDEDKKWEITGTIIQEWIGEEHKQDKTGVWPDDFFRKRKFDAYKLTKKIRENQKKITDLGYEARFGNGGDDQELITGNKVTTIGTVLNDLPSYRIDPIGKIRNQGTFVAKAGTYLSMAQCPLIEYVDVDSIPGGDWDVVVGNKYRLNVGSKGVHIKTTGPLDIYGAMVNLYGEGIYVSAKHELLIDGGKHTEIRGDIICLKPSDVLRKEVLIDGNAGVAGNLKVLGGIHVEGELYNLHMTAPKEKYLTEIGYGPVAHTHIFYAPPWTLLEKCTDVREAAAKCNESQPAPNEKCFSYWLPG